MAMRHRKVLVSLAGGSQDGGDEPPEELAVWRYHYRGGDVDLFYREDPEHILIEQVETEEEVRAAEAARKICILIIDELTEDQRTVFRLRLEGKAFVEIAQLTGRGMRAVYYDWKKIREVAYRHKADFLSG